MWSLVLSLPDEMLQMVLTKMPLSALVVIRRFCSRLFHLIQPILEKQEVQERFTWNNAHEMTFEPTCRAEARVDVQKHYTSFTTVLKSNDEVTKFLEDMDDEAGFQLLGKSVALDFEQPSRVHVERTLEVSKVQALMDRFGFNICHLSIHSLKIRSCRSEIRDLFGNLTNLKSLAIYYAKHYSRDNLSLTERINQPGVSALGMLRYLKLENCDESICATFVSAGLNSLEYLNLSHCYITHEFFQVLSAHRSFAKLKYFTFKPSPYCDFDIIRHIFNKQGVSFDGLRISVMPTSHPWFSVIELASDMKHLKNFQLQVYNSEFKNEEDYARRVSKLPNNYCTYVLYLPFWSIKCDWLISYLEKFVNLKKLVFLYENLSVRMEVDYIPLRVISEAQKILKKVTIPKILVKHGSTTFDIKTSGIKYNKKRCVF